MGLVLDSGVVIAAERRGDTVEQFIARVIKATDDQDAAFGELRPIASSRLSLWVPGSNPISHPNFTRLRPADMAYTLGPLALPHKQ